MFSFSKEKCRRFMLAACLLLSAACSLSVAAAEEESAAEKIKRYEKYQKLFRKELNAQRRFIPDLRSEYDYTGGSRPSERSYSYFFDRNDRRRAERNSRKRVEEWEENNSVYTICWSFAPFEGTGAELKAGKNNITYCIITADFIDISQLKSTGQTEANLITFPQEFFPISLLAQRTVLKKQFGSDVEESEVRTYYYSRNYQDRSNLPHIYILALKPCSKPKLTSFYRENIFKKLDQNKKDTLLQTQKKKRIQNVEKEETEETLQRTTTYDNPEEQIKSETVRHAEEAETAVLEADGTLILEMGLDTSIKFFLVDGALVAENNGRYGGIGTHNDLSRYWPRLYFGKAACYAGNKVWDLKQKLIIPSHPKQIARVVLLKSGRNYVSINDDSRYKRCGIIWNSQLISMYDNESSSSMYKIKIFFE